MVGWRRGWIACGGWATMLAAAAMTRGDEPKPIPATRGEIKAALERLKLRQPRLPLPPLEAVTAGADRRGRVNNGRARRLYLPAEWFAADFQNDDSFELDYPFKTRLFWIVSRGNNCHYCLGHQEHKLSAVGMSDDQIAALDSRWSDYPAREQAAFALARQLTLEPQRTGPADLDSLRTLFSDRQLVELVYTISFFNGVNRWTDALGLPQDESFGEHPIHFDQPTSAPFAQAESCVVRQPGAARDPIDEISLAALVAAARARRPAVPLPEETIGRQVLGEVWPAAEPLPAWARVLALFPQAGRGHVAALRAIGTAGRLPAATKARLARVVARENRAWYAWAEAQRWLDRLAAIASEPSEAESLAERLAVKLTVSPQSIADDDVAELRRVWSDHQVAEIIYVTAAANFFDRLTETLGLPVEP